MISRNVNNIKRNNSLNKKINSNKNNYFCVKNINSQILYFTKRGSKNNNSLMYNIKQLSKNKYISPRANHEVTIKKENNKNWLSPYNYSSNPNKNNISKKKYFIILKNEPNNDEIKSKKNFISVNVGNKYKRLFCEGETEKSQKKLIKINKICNSEGNLILPYKRKENNGQNIIVPKSNERNAVKNFDIDNNLNINENIIELSPKKYIESHLNILSIKKKHNKSKIISSNFYNFINNKEKKKGVEDKKGNKKNNLNLNFNIYGNNSIISDSFNNRTLYQKNKKNKMFKSNTTQKYRDKKVLYDLKPKKLKNICLSDNSKNKFI